MTKPLKKIRLGSISAAIWKQESENGPFPKVTIDGVYTDDEGKPQSTNSFTLEELPKVRELTELSELWIKLNFHDHI